MIGWEANYILNEEKEFEKESCQLAAMNLRAYLIREFGTEPLHPILDSEYLVKWFLDSLNLPINQVYRQCKTYQKFGIKKITFEQLKYLRKLKNRLAVIKLLSESDQIKPTNILKKWLLLYEILP